VEVSVLRGSADVASYRATAASARSDRTTVQTGAVGRGFKPGAAL
jgi:hypothetical protein